MTTPLRSMVVLAPFDPNRISHQDLRNSRVSDSFGDTRTHYARFWADWPTWQPNAGDPIGSAIYANGPIGDQLDAQVRYARSRDWGVIITAYRFPRWANGTLGVDESTFEYAHRFNNHPDPQQQRLKQLEFRTPQDLSTTGPWGRWIEHLCWRYGWNGLGGQAGQVADFIEVCNEPNLQMFPIKDSAGNGPISCTVTQMFQTAKAWANYWNVALAGPGTSDTQGRSWWPREYWDESSSFQTGVRNACQGQGFNPGPGFLWTHHNYHDVENDLDYGQSVVKRTIDQLATWWDGWPSGSRSNSQVFLTEGGMTPANGQSTQAARIRRNAERMRAAPRVGMMATYLMYSVNTYDTGLRNGAAGELWNAVPGGDGPELVARQAYNTWWQLNRSVAEGGLGVFV